MNRNQHADGDTSANNVQAPQNEQGDDVANNVNEVHDDQNQGENESPNNAQNDAEDEAEEAEIPLWCIKYYVQPHEPNEYEPKSQSRKAHD